MTEPKTQVSQRAREALADAFDAIGPTGYARHIRSIVSEGTNGWFWAKPALQAIEANLRQPTPAVVEALGDALHGLSARMLVERAFETEAIHTAYERVVKAFAALDAAALSAAPQTDPQGEAVREAFIDG